MDHRASTTGRGGFSLVELLVVIGIITILIGMVLPAVMSARRSARLAVCRANLREIGILYHIYATSNNDYIPLGTTCVPPTPWPSYHTANNQFFWYEGAPSAAAGPFISGSLIKPESAKILHCPLEAQPDYDWEMNRALYHRAAAGEAVTIQISYAVRPLKALWTHDPANRTVTYPFPMPKLVKQKHYALMAEHPQSQPYNHTSQGNAMNALYADGSVRSLSAGTFKAQYDLYVNLAAPYPPGFTPPSNVQAINLDDKSAVTIWRIIDEN